MDEWLGKKPQTAPVSTCSSFSSVLKRSADTADLDLDMGCSTSTNESEGQQDSANKSTTSATKAKQVRYIVDRRSS